MSRSAPSTLVLFVFSSVLLLWTGCQDDVYVDSDTQMGNTTAENQDDRTDTTTSGTSNTQREDMGLEDTGLDMIECGPMGCSESDTDVVAEDTGQPDVPPPDCGGLAEDEASCGDDTDTDLMDEVDTGTEALCLQSEPSVQEVSVELVNTSDTVRYLLTEGTLCDPFEVRHHDNAGPSMLAPGYVCGCECPAPPPVSAQRFVRLEPGQSHTLYWDARVLDTCQVAYDCIEWTAYEPSGSPQQAAPGAYTLTFGVVDLLPQHCFEEGDGVFCDPWVDGWGEGSGPYQVLCPDVDRVDVEVMLPVSGDVTVRARVP